MAKILISDGIEKSAAEELGNIGHVIIKNTFAPHQLKNEIRNFDVIIVRSATKINKDIIDGALLTKRLKLIIRAGVGLDNIDMNYALENGIAVENTPEASIRSVAELTIGHIFSLARHIYISNVTMRAGKWEKKNYEGIELQGKTLGLIGFGNIGKETASIARALGMNVIYNSRSGKKECEDEYKYVTFEEILRMSDFISLHIPFNKATGMMIDRNEFELMKDGVFFINCSRGGIVNEEALLDALDSGKVASAAMDVFEHEPVTNRRLYSHDKVSLTPHIGASTYEAQIKIGKGIVSIVKKYYS